MIEAARQNALRVITFPPATADVPTADALAHVPHCDEPTTAVWLGYIPGPDRYAAVERDLAGRGLALINTLDQHRTAQEFDRWYDRLRDLTIESATVTDLVDVPRVVDTLGLPLFIKGAIQSNKARGLTACVAKTVADVERLTGELLTDTSRSVGRVVLRRFTALRHSRTDASGFPYGREFRAFIGHGEVLSLAYYWEGEDDRDLTILRPAEREQVVDLARMAATRLAVPYLTVDIGQLVDGTWRVIETGDGQFSGLSLNSPFAIWRGLLDVLELQR